MAFHPIDFPAQAPDEPTTFVVGFNSSWVGVLVALLEEMKFAEAWIDPPSDFIPQIEQLQAQLMEDIG